MLCVKEISGNEYRVFGVNDGYNWKSYLTDVILMKEIAKLEI